MVLGYHLGPLPQVYSGEEVRDHVESESRGGQEYLVFDILGYPRIQLLAVHYW